MVDSRERRHAGVSAPQLRCDARMPSAETIDVQLVDDGLVPRRARCAHAAPIEGRGYHLALGQLMRIVAPVERQILALAAGFVAEVRIGPAQPADDGLGIRIQQQLVGIETQPVFGLVRAVYAIAVQLARLGFRQIAAPYLVGLLAQPDAREFALAGTVEQAQLDLLRVLGKQGEIDPFPVPVSAL